MKNTKPRVAIVLFWAAFIVISCASVQPADESGIEPEKTESVSGLLPLAEGWYQYDFEKLIKGIEDEYNFTVSTGMKMIEEITWKYAGVVCRFEDGVLYDPLANIELAIDNEGRITCAENISIKGQFARNGSFFWSGQQEENGRLNSLFVKGTLMPLPAQARGGREFDGVYHLIDSGSGREQLANVSDGFYTWRYIDGEEAGFTPWPLLIRPDGSFGGSMEITTVMEMGELSKTNFSNGFLFEGTITPGKNISLEEISRSTGIGLDQGGAPQIYAGTVIRAGEFPNEAIPDNIENLIRSGRAEVRARPKNNPADYPAWYIKLPGKPGFLYAAGEKTFDDRDTAFAMAEAAAAAGIAEQRRVRIEETITAIANNEESRIDMRLTSESVERLNFRIIEREYNEKTRTAFVLAEMMVN